MTLIEYLVNLFVYELLILGCSAPVLVLLLRLCGYLTTGRAGTLSVGLVWLFGGSWIAHNASRRHVFQREGFFGAIGSAFVEGRLLISFVPVVGKLFPVRSLNSSQLDEPDDPRSE